MNRIAIFASGKGSNAKNIIEYFKGHNHIEVSLIVSNKENAYVLQVAEQNDIPHLVIKRNEFYHSDTILKKTQSFRIDFIVLAGFLLLIPVDMTNYYNKKMLNIHPSLLPKYGGKGMYGMKVHQAVKDAGDNVSGMTIHYVNPKFDEGEIIFQASCPLKPTDTAKDIAQKVLVLEHKYFPRIVEHTILTTFDF